MLRHQREDEPNLTGKLDPIIKNVESNDALADALLKQLSKSSHWRSGEGTGFFNLFALSSLPFIAISQIQIGLPSLLHRAKIYGEAIGNINIVVTPYDDINAKATDGQCSVSLGFVNLAYCVSLYLLCLEGGMISSNDWLMATSIPDYRAKFCDFLGLNIKSEIANEFVYSNFRCDSYRPFTEMNEVLEKLGVDCETVNNCLTSGNTTKILLATLLANMCIRFLVLHELAHQHYGHNELLEIWVKNEGLAEKIMDTGFPSNEARRAMENYADVWAVEMLIISEVFSNSSVLENELVGGPIPPLTRAKFAIIAVELTFAILAAQGSVASKNNGWYDDFQSALKGRIDTMYPGAPSRAAFAVLHGIKNAASDYPYLRWTRWRAMKKEIFTIDSKALGLLINQLWFACSLGGGMFPVKRGSYEYFPNTESLNNLELNDVDDRQSWQTWDRFDYIREHQKLLGDLSRAKKWASSRRSEK